MQYDIIGDNLQVANVSISPNEFINAEAGALAYKTGNITIDVESKGFLSAIKRLIVGESLFLTRFKSVGGQGLVGFAGKIPGKIVAFDLQPGQSVIAENGAYLCSDHSVEIGIHLVKKLGVGLFAGEGLILQKLTGPGTVLIHAAGDLINYYLNQGERIDVKTSHLVAFDPTVSYDIRRVGSIKTTVFGGQGLFLAQMKGPGRVVLQSMTKEIFQPQGESSSHSRGGLIGRLI